MRDKHVWANRSSKIWFISFLAQNTELLGFHQTFVPACMHTRLVFFANARVHQPLKKIVEEVKKGSSKWMKTKDGTSNREFHWQNGYAAFSVSQSNVDEVRKYIENQEKHHRKMTFQDELR